MVGNGVDSRAKQLRRLAAWRGLDPATIYHSSVPNPPGKGWVYFLVDLSLVYVDNSLAELGYPSLRHKDDGPSVFRPDGTWEIWINGSRKLVGRDTPPYEDNANA